MISLELDVHEAVRVLKHHGPENINRATWSALGSVGYKVAAEVKRQIRGGYGWPRKATRFRRKRGMRWWARFIKYRRFDQQAANVASGAGVQAGARGMSVVILPLKDDRHGTVEIDGRNYRRMRQRDSRYLHAVFRKFEEGETFRVTPAMRRRLAAYGMPVKKRTTVLRYQPRPIFGPAWNRQKTWLPVYFNNKFFDNLYRYQSGLSVREWRRLGEQT